MNPDEDPWAECVRPVYRQLVESMRLVSLLDQLYGTKAITREEYNQLRTKIAINPSDANRDLLSDVLPRKLPKKKYFDLFVDVLRSVEHHDVLADLICPPKPLETTETAEPAEPMESLPSGGDSGEGVASAVDQDQSMDTASASPPPLAPLPDAESTTPSSVDADTGIAAAPAVVDSDEAEVAARPSEGGEDLPPAEEEETASSPTIPQQPAPPEKRAVIFLPTSIEMPDKLEIRLCGMFNQRLGIDRSNVMIIPEDDESSERKDPEDDQSTKRIGPGDVALVVAEKMQVYVILEGIEESQFAAFKPFLQLAISGMFKVKKSSIVIQAELKENSVGVLIEVPMEVALGIACLSGEEENAMAFGGLIKSCLPAVTGVVISIGGLPQWRIPLLEEPPEPPEIREEVLSSLPGDIDFHDTSSLTQHLADSKLTIHETYAFMTEIFPRLLAQLAPDEQQDWKDAFLFHASAHDLLILAILLLEEEPDPLALINDSDINRQITSIHKASIHGKADMVKLLISASEDAAEAVEAIDEHRNTALHYSAQYNNVECARHLLAADANSNASNKYGYTPAHLAAETDVGNGQIFELLRENGAKFDKRTKRLGYTPVDLAVRWDNEEALDALMRLGGSATTTSRFGLKPIHHAAALSAKKCFYNILLNGGNPKDVSLLGSVVDLGLASGLADIKDVLIDSLFEVVQTHKNKFLADADKAFAAQRDLERVNDELNDNLKLLEDRCNTLFNDSKILKKEVEDLEKKVNDQQAQADKNREEMDQIAKQVQDKQEELQKEVDEQSKFTEQLNKEVDQIKELHEELQKTVEEQTKDLEKLETEGEETTGEPGEPGEDQPTGEEATGGGEEATASALGPSDESQV
eukprot:m.7692 g.7692  ORF g.7692 m.7692 type:complete len:868 (+) comp19425_c0_seq1:1803-4406(+)